ncbi:MAG: ketosteroid isomerase-related protein [Luteibacter sp.]
MNETIDLICRYYEAFNRGDRTGMLDLLDEHVAHDVNQGGRETGRQRFAAFLERMSASYSEQVRNLVIMANEAGNRAAAEYMVHGEYKATDEGLPLAQGQSYALPGGSFFDVAGGKITRVSNYYYLEDWLAQVRRIDVD